MRRRCWRPSFLISQPTPQLPLPPHTDCGPAGVLPPPGVTRNQHVALVPEFPPVAGIVAHCGTRVLSGPGPATFASGMSPVYCVCMWNRLAASPPPRRLRRAGAPAAAGRWRRRFDNVSVGQVDGGGAERGTTAPSAARGLCRSVSTAGVSLSPPGWPAGPGAGVRPARRACTCGGDSGRGVTQTHCHRPRTGHFLPLGNAQSNVKMFRSYTRIRVAGLLWFKKLNHMSENWEFSLVWGIINGAKSTTCACLTRAPLGAYPAPSRIFAITWKPRKKSTRNFQYLIGHQFDTLSKKC